jgi:hypothetical protein
VQWLITHDNPTWVMPRHGIQIADAIITDPVGLENAQVSLPVSITNSEIKGDLIVSGAHFASHLMLSRSTVNHDFRAGGFSVGGNLELEQTIVKHQVNLIRANVEGFGHFKGLMTTQLVINTAHLKHDLMLDDAIIANDKTSDLAPCVSGRPQCSLCGHAIIVDGQLMMANQQVPKGGFGTSR